MTIRAAVAKDLEALLALERAVSTAPHWPAADYAAIVQGCSPVPRMLLVAITPMGLAGFAVAATVAGEAELESVVVAPDWRRQGIARALLTTLLAQMEVQMEARLCRLEVRVSSEGAIALYRQLGFHPIGVRPGYYEHPAEDALLMELPLAPVAREAELRDV